MWIVPTIGSNVKMHWLISKRSVGCRHYLYLNLSFIYLSSWLVAYRHYQYLNLYFIYLFIQLVGRVKTRQAQTAAIYHLRNPPLDNSKISSESTPQIHIFICSQSFSYLFFVNILIYRGFIIKSQQILCTSAKRTI